VEQIQLATKDSHVITLSAEARDLGVRRQMVDVILSLILGSVFIVSGVSHWQTPYHFLGSVYAYGLLGPLTGQTVAMLLPSLLLLVGGCLVTRFWLDAAHVLAFTMLVMFVTAQTFALLRGLDISCGCFGACDETSIGVTTLRPVIGLLLLSSCRAGLRLYGAI
jgi:hypothetical protein